MCCGFWCLHHAPQFSFCNYLSVECSDYSDPAHHVSLAVTAGKPRVGAEWMLTGSFLPWHHRVRRRREQAAEIILTFFFPRPSTPHHTPALTSKWKNIESGHRLTASLTRFGSWAEHRADSCCQSTSLQASVACEAIGFQVSLATISPCCPSSPPPNQGISSSPLRPNQGKAGRGPFQEQAGKSPLRSRAVY